MSELDNKELSLAAQNGDLEQLLKHIDGANQETLQSSLTAAAYNGHDDIVAALIPFCPSKMENSEALRIAAMFDFETCVELLIPVSDPLIM